jgi:hypothetical protein
VGKLDGQFPDRIAEAVVALARGAVTVGSTVIWCARQRCHAQSRGVRCSSWRDSDTGLS